MRTTLSGRDTVGSLSQICTYIGEGMCVSDGLNIWFQDALSAEINKLGLTYGKETLEKNPGASHENKDPSRHTFVDFEQFSR